MPDLPDVPGSPTQESLPLFRLYDTALLDLDGVVYAGPNAIEHAVEVLARARAAGMRLAYVTNNASRTPDAVSTHLTELGVPAEPADVITSAQAAARLVAGLVPEGSAVLVVGGEGLVQAGLTLVLSLAVTAIVTAVMIWLTVWQPPALYAFAVIGVASCAVRLLRGGRQCCAERQ